MILKWRSLSSLSKAVEEQTEVISGATIEVTTARRLLDQTERDRPPPLAQSERDTPHPDLGVPVTAIQAAEFAKQCDELSQQFDAEADKADENLTRVSNRLGVRNVAVERYDNLPTRLRRIIGDGAAATELSAEFQGDDAKDRPLVDVLESNFDSCQSDLERAQKAAARVYSENYTGGISGLRELEGKTVDAVERMRRLLRNDLEGRIGFWIDEIRAHGLVIAQELADFDTERRTVYRPLMRDDCVRDAETVLRCAKATAGCRITWGMGRTLLSENLGATRRSDQAERLVLPDRKAR